MYEVELKVRAAHEAVRPALAGADADRTGEVVQEDTYYDAPHREFAETDEALRIRRERRDGDARAVVTYKGPLVEAASKTREEIETGVDDGGAMGEVFDRLGFDPVATVRKERERYDLEGFTVTLDDVDDVGEFVEIEREVPEGEVDPTRERARELLADIGLDPDEHVRTSYLGLLLDGEE